MLKCKKKWFSKYYGKWERINYSKCKQHLDFNKYTYKNGHKRYTAMSQEVKNLFNDEKEQHFMWVRLTE